MTPCSWTVSEKSSISRPRSGAEEAPVAHVDQVAVEFDRGLHGAGEGGAGHAVQPRVADLDRDNLRAGRDAVPVGLIRKVGGDNAGDVRAVVSAHHDDREQFAVVLDVDRVVQLRRLAERRELPLAAIVRQQRLIGEVAVLVGVDRRPPLFAVVKRDAVIHRTGIVVGLLRRLQQIEPRLQFFAFLLLCFVRTRVCLVPVGERLLQFLLAHALPLVPVPATFGQQAVQQLGRKQFPGSLDPQPVFAARVVPVLRDGQAASAQSLEPPLFGLAACREVDVAAAGGVDHVDDLRPAVGGRLQAGRAGIDAGVEHGDDHSAAVPFRMRCQEPRGPGFLFRQQVLRRKRRGLRRR